MNAKREKAGRKLRKAGRKQGESREKYRSKEAVQNDCAMHLEIFSLPFFFLNLRMKT
jgi:hypothetical protein